MSTLFGMYPFLRKLYADGGYQGSQFQQGLKRVCGQVSVEIVKRSDAAKGFAVLPKRWIVERSIAWLNRCRRLAKDWECLNCNALAFLRRASIRLMVRKPCRKTISDGLLGQVALRLPRESGDIEITLMGGTLFAPPMVALMLETSMQRGYPPRSLRKTWPARRPVRLPATARR
jgi:transposase